MIKVVIFLLAFAIADVGGILLLHHPAFPEWLASFRLLILCILMGGLGGAVYCLRGVYLNASVRKSWDPSWHPWYYIRPFVSLACGGISYVFLKAGLLILEASQKNSSTDLGFLALAFISGLNVDKFISKIEDIAQAAWGIEKTRTTTRDED